MNQLILFLFALAFIACDSPISENTLDEKQVEKEVMKMFEDYHLAIKKGGLTAEFDFLDDSEDFYWVPPGYQSALDIDSVKTILNGNASLFKTIEFRWHSIQVYPISPEIATYTGIVNGEMTDTTGQVIAVSILESGTVIRRETGWKLLCGQSRNLE